VVVTAIYRGLCLRKADRYLGRTAGADEAARPLSAGDVLVILAPEAAPARGAGKPRPEARDPKQWPSPRH
jgi:hypothetical protein